MPGNFTPESLGLNTSSCNGPVRGRVVITFSVCRVILTSTMYIVHSTLKTEKNCFLAEEIGKEIWRNATWIDLYQDLFDEFIPFNSNAAKTMKIGTCTTFKKSDTSSIVL